MEVEIGILLPQAKKTKDAGSYEKLGESMEHIVPESPKQASTVLTP